MATYKLRRLHPGGRPYTDNEMREYFRENPLTIPSMTANPVKPIMPPKPDGWTNRKFQDEIWNPWFTKFWLPYQVELMAQDDMINTLAAELAGRFTLCLVVTRTGEMRPRAPFWGGYINWARTLTGYYGTRPEHPMEFISKQSITT